MEKVMTPTPEHVALMDALKATIEAHPDMPAMEILAVASQFVGMLIAAQDRRTVTPDMALAVVEKNIEAGNAIAILANERGLQ